MVLLVFLATFAGVHQADHAAGSRGNHRIRVLCTSQVNSSRAIWAVRSSADGSVTVRLVGQQYSFTPQCIVVPTDTPITIRATSADVVHGLLIEHTNINTMLVPGYIATTQHALRDTRRNATCPATNSAAWATTGMWGRVQIIEKADFHEARGAARRD